MTQKIQIKTLMLYLPFLLWSTTAFSMIAWINRQRSQQNLQSLQQCLQSKDLEEIDGYIRQMQNNVSHECIEELARITCQSYDLLKSERDHARASIREVLKKPHRHAIHDTSIPKPLYEQICTTLRHEGIHPKSTTLHYMADSKDPDLYASSQGTCFIDGYHVLEPKIRLFPPLLEESEEIQLFIQNHEISHILLQHTSMTDTINEFNPDADTKHLKSIKEREADIYTASKSSRLACAGAILSCKLGHNNIIDNSRHCTKMLTMCELLKRKEELS
jgi:hypothetical protein